MNEEGRNNLQAECECQYCCDTTNTVIVVYVTDSTETPCECLPCEQIPEDALEAKPCEDNPVQPTDYLGVDRLDTPISRPGCLGEVLQLPSTYG